MSPSSSYCRVASLADSLARNNVTGIARPAGRVSAERRRFRQPISRREEASASCAIDDCQLSPLFDDGVWQPPSWKAHLRPRYEHRSAESPPMKIVARGRCYLFAATLRYDSASPIRYISSIIPRLTCRGRGRHIIGQTHKHRESQERAFGLYYINNVRKSKQQHEKYQLIRLAK